MAEEGTHVSEDEARGKGTKLEQYGGPRFVLVCAFDIFYFLYIITSSVLVSIGKIPPVIDPLLIYMIISMNGIYFANRTYEKMKQPQ